ncbi:MAG: acetyltransferase [Gammaproteobacteria bacterium]|nr:acetyltransferase [Gammaproteobacteria bacterium]
MSHYDVFNGDADGLCALQQLRLHTPVDNAILITGVKRDIALLQRVEAAAGDTLTVLDISLDKNREALRRLLDLGCHIDYIDHHFAGEIPSHPHLTTTIDTAPEICTSLLVDHRLAGGYRGWAVAGAFGDNFHEMARRVAQPLGLNDEQLESLSELGTCLNYNGYGVALDDLFFHPAALATAMRPYRDPLDFIASERVYQTLREGYHDDIGHAEALRPEQGNDRGALFILPDEPWARRISGVYGNLLARVYPERAHAILTRMENGSFRVSVRAPLTTRQGADLLCREFTGGGGRQAAAGINELPPQQYDYFMKRFFTIFK